MPSSSLSLAPAAGRPVPAEDAPRQGGDPVGLYADNSFARELLGWEARRDLAAIVTSAWRWHAGHPDGYASGPPTGADVTEHSRERRVPDA